jgi:hypothetical protein
MYKQAQAIKSKQDLCEFLDIIVEDLRTNRKDWENDSLDRYLSAMAQFTKDFEGYRIHNPLSEGEDPSWRTFGEILAAAIYYE